MIEYSIIGAGVQIKEMSRVERGCLIADRITIGPQAKVEPFQKLLKKSQGDRVEDEEEDEEDEGDEDDEADDEEEEEDNSDEEDESTAEEDDSDYEEIEASKGQLKQGRPRLMSCSRSGSRCARKTWAGIQCYYMA